MLTAIQEIADHRADEEKEHEAALAYFKACNLLFENGTLSHTPIYNMSSETLKNLRKGFYFFKHWKDSFLAGTYMTLNLLMKTCFHFYPEENIRAPTQTLFLAWQVTVHYAGYQF